MIHALIIALLPLIAHYIKVTTPEILVSTFNWATEYDLLIIYKNKFLWIMTFLSLFCSRIPPKKTLLPIAIYLIFLLQATVNGLDTSLSISGVRDYADSAVNLICYAVLVLTARDLKTKHLIKAIKFLIIGLAFVSSLQLMFGNFLQLPFIEWMTGTKWLIINGANTPIYATLGNPNHMGFLCSLLFPLTLSFGLTPYAIISFILLVGSGSRAAMLSVAIVIVIIGVGKYSRKKMAVIGFVVALCCVSTILSRINSTLRDLRPIEHIDDLKEFTVKDGVMTIREGEANITVRANQVPPGGIFFPYRNTLTRMVANDNKVKVFLYGKLWDTAPHRKSILPESIFSGRGFIWPNTLTLLTWFGKGPATFVLNFPHLDLLGKIRAGWDTNAMVVTPHNVYLEIAYSTGILSLIPLGYLIFLALRRKTVYSMAIISTLVCAFFTDSFVGATPLICIVIGKAIGENN